MSHHKNDNSSGDCSERIHSLEVVGAVVRVYAGYLVTDTTSAECAHRLCSAKVGAPAQSRGDCAEYHLERKPVPYRLPSSGKEG